MIQHDNEFYKSLNYAPYLQNLKPSDYMVEAPNEHHLELLSTLGLDVFCAMNSSSRKQMFSSNMQQWLPVKGATQRLLQTGVEREFAKFTFSCKIRETSTIIKAINRYPTSGFNAIEQNPETIVIYENSITNEVDYMSITTHFSGLHSYFGFMYKFKPENMALLKPNAAIKAGTIFADSPSVDVDGGYKTGIELETAYLSMPENDEDGVIFCEDTKPQLTFPLFASRVIEFGSKTFLLNLRGDDKVYKPMPDIGEYLSDDNILAAAREYDPAIAGSMMNSKWLRQVDYRGDDVTYGSGSFALDQGLEAADKKRFGKIVDIRVIHDAKNSRTILTPQMREWVDKYASANKTFYQKILNEYTELRRSRAENLKITPAFSGLITDAIEFSGSSRVNSVKEYKKKPIDDYRIEVVIQYDVVPTYGFKITDTAGCKGVFCGFWPKERMPVNAIGRRCDVIMAPRAVPNRMDFGAALEHFINGVSSDFIYFVSRELKLPENPTVGEVKMSMNQEPELWEYLARKFWRFLFYVSPDHAYALQDNGVDMKAELAHAIVNRIFHHMPPGAQNEHVQIPIDVTRMFPQVYGPLTYIDHNGVKRETIENARIGSKYYLLLEKICNDWLATNSARLQIFGFLTPVPKHLKYKRPMNDKAVKQMSETEIRHALAYIDGMVVADSVDMSSSPQTHEAVCHELLTSPDVMNIERVVNRDVNGYTGHVGLLMLKHMLMCAGIRLIYKPYQSK